MEKAKEMSGNENADEKNVCRPLPRRGGGLAAATVPVQCSALQLVFFYFISDLKTKDNFIELSDEF